MGLPIYEQETNINFMRDEDTATVYTSDSTTMTKLDKLIAFTGYRMEIERGSSVRKYRGDCRQDIYLP